MAVRYIDVSSLRTVDSGTCVDTSPASAVRCTISILRVELRRVVLRAHVINDTEEAIRCAPGVKRGSTAQLQTDLDLICDPHAEMGFLFALPRFAAHSRSAFVRVEGTSFACGFTCELDDDGRTLAVVAVAGIAAVVVAAAVVGVVLYERNRRRKASYERRPQAPPPAEEPAPSAQSAQNEPITGEVVEEAEPVKTAVPAETETTQTIGQYQFGTTTPQEARGFAAVVGEERVVMGAVECTKRRFASSEFVAKVVNQANEPLLCTVSGRTRRGPAFVAPGYFWVHPQSAAAITIAASLRLPWRLRTIALQMQNSALRASAEADVPAPPLVRVATAAAALIFLLLATTLAFRSARPNIEAFALPPEVLAGNSVTASYGISGIGTARYTIVYRGTTVASGTIPSGNGTFAFPTGRHPGTYHVTLSSNSPFGKAQEALDVDAVSHLTPVVATIDTLEVDPEVVSGGKPVTVRYIAHAQSGTVTLLDAAQIPLQTVPYGQQGSSVLTAPPVDTPTQYRVALEVTRGVSTTRASVGLLVIPANFATPAPSTSPIAGVLTASQLLRIVPAHVVSARYFTVQLLSHPTDLRLTLQDDHGTPVATKSVGPNARSVNFEAPYVTANRHFLIVASFTRGDADQVILDPVVIHPH